MVMISFDFFKVMKWTLCAALRLFISPLVFYPLLVATFVNEILAFWAGIEDIYDSILDSLTISIPSDWNTYIFGGVGNGISSSFCYATGLDVVIKNVFMLPGWLFTIMYCFVSGAIIFYSLKLLWKFRGYIARWLNGIIPS